MTTPDRTTAAAFHRYAAGEVVADSATLQWPDLYVRRYLRPFLESYTQVNVPQLSLLLLGLGMAGFAGTYGAGALVGRHLYRLMSGLPLAADVFRASVAIRK